MSAPLRPTPEQARAADPRLSVWVTANAGTGKTRVLVDRILRLLLAGAAPESILAITFTRAAAAEMVERVERRLADWATAADDATLAADLEALLGTAPDEASLRTAAELFARVLDLPSGLAIETVHALCLRLLKRFPLEAGVPPHFQPIDERTESELLADARAFVLERAAGGADPALRAALAELAVTLADEALREALDEVVRARGRLAALLAQHGSAEALIAAIHRALGLEPGDSEAGLREAAAAEDAFDRTALVAAAAALEAGTAAEAKRGAELSRWLAAGPEARATGLDAYAGEFLTDAGQPRARLATAATEKARPGTQAALEREAERLARVMTRLRACAHAGRVGALLRVGLATIAAYEARKQAASQLDFNDLIERTRALLRRPDIGPWVLYKLDAAIDHVLVDEAQDTNPEQWEVVLALAEDLLAGQGAERWQTLFVVGDRKQSIYSFQGADLAAFDRVRARLGGIATEIELNRSFRSTEAVLGLVDAVLEDESCRAGVVLPGRTVRHEAARQGEAGLVELWPLLPPAARVETEDFWLPPARPAVADEPERRLARQIAATVSGWLAQGERLEGSGRPIRAGDVMILLSRRGRAQELIVQALKRAGVPVQGADRIKLLEHLAVQDLVALGRAVLLPDDDLTLAALLKSPLIGLDETALFTLAHARGRASLVERLRERAAEPPFDQAWARLEGWLRRADFSPPFEFYSDLLGREGGRRRLLARLGQDAAEAIEAFLAQALAFERGHPASLEGFLHWLGGDDVELKRDPEASGDAVRVLTVHGAKGLEAPIVILADAGPQQTPQHGRLVWRQADGLPLWRGVKGRRDPVTEAACAERDALALEERNRLLYVALTRARDRLYIAGWQTRRHSEGGWHGRIASVMAGLPGVERETRPLGRGLTGTIWRWRRGLAVAAPAAAPEPAPPPPAPPAWLSQPAPPEPRPARPLAPSRADLAAVAAAGPAGPLDEAAVRFGRHAHRLLQLLAGLDPPDRDRALDRYVATIARDLPGDARDRLARQVRAVLEAPGLAALFAPGSRAEVAIVGRLGEVVVSGQVDRLVVTPDAVLVVDFKTGRAPAAAEDAVPVAYLRQMALYRDLLRAIHPDRPVRTALVWTETLALQVLPDALLDRHAPPVAALTDEERHL
mgnify:CR=1 FL=1